jgi:uncharacterized protein DUF6879
VGAQGSHPVGGDAVGGDAAGGSGAYRRLDYDELEAAFDEFTSRVVRLENLDTYTTPHEAERLAGYLAGLDNQPPSESSWNLQMAAQVQAGRQWAKVHVLRDPTAPYFRYAAEWSWPNSSRYGQDVRILDLTGQEQPGDIPDADFWVIDDTVVLMHYDDAGVWQHAELVPSADRLRYLNGIEVALELSVPFDRWWQAHPEHHRASWLRPQP